LVPVTTVVSQASSRFGSIYDISGYRGGEKTYKRARDAYDALTEYIDDLTRKTTWRVEAAGA
jgi:chromosome partitioning protein